MLRDCAAGAEATLKAPGSPSCQPGHRVGFQRGFSRSWDRGQMRILVVDDDQNLAGALQRGLRREGYAVDVAYDGTEAHWLATETAYDAMVLDWMLPGIDGTELCEKLRQAGVWTPILMLTARSGNAEEAGALDCGAD